MKSCASLMACRQADLESDTHNHPIVHLGSELQGTGVTGPVAKQGQEWILQYAAGDMNWLRSQCVSVED